MWYYGMSVSVAHALKHCVAFSKQHEDAAFIPYASTQWPEWGDATLVALA